MNPTDHRYGREGAPTVREIADLLGGLRELSARDREIEPRERAAFLADKEALLARITESATATDEQQDGAEPAPTRIGEIQMPAWMREQAARAEAATPGPALPMGERAALAARDEALRGQLGHVDTGQSAHAVSPAPVDVDEATRREQLARWHTDDAVVSDTQGDVWDDGPGLP